jgi:uncharacterized MAPEG superfamily protein/predicted nucleic-acid-binding protein
MLAVDTNVVVRYLVRDDDVQSTRARDIIRSGAIFVSLTVILEREWVLRGLYGFSRSEVIGALEAFCGTPDVSVADAATIERAFRLTELGLDFADALHLAQAKGCQAFVTFDKRLAQKSKGSVDTPIGLAWSRRRNPFVPEGCGRCWISESGEGECMTELVCLELSVVLWIVHVVIQAAVGNAELPSGYLFTSRDKPAAASGLMFGRATRALANYVENLTPFVALALALIVTQRTGGLGATIWILARIVYIPLYLFDLVYARTAVWAISLIGLLMMLGRLAF